MTPSVLITETGIKLQPDHTRVISQFFMPDIEDVAPGYSRLSLVTKRIFDLDEDEVEVALSDIDGRFMDRHQDLHKTFAEHAAQIMGRISSDVKLSKARRLLLGASFTHEYAIEGAALCNPSIVLDPSRDRDGYTGFVMSVRGIGEGHISSIGFRTGTISATGTVLLDPLSPYSITTPATPSVHHRSMFHMQLSHLAGENTNVAQILDALPEKFDNSILKECINKLKTECAGRHDTDMAIANLENTARSTYRIEFSPTSELSERVLWPQTPAERHGMEDARFVRFTADDGEVTYYATYTAFDGIGIAQHLLKTQDFRTFSVSPIICQSVVEKGLALFPRKVNGRYTGLSQSDRGSNSISFSDDIRC